MRLCLTLMMLLAAAMVVSGCSQSESSTAVAGPVNTHCPIIGHEIAEDGGSTTWNGQTVAFCCEGCLPKWNELSDDDKATKLADAGKGSHDHGEHSGHDHASYGHES